MNGSVYELQRGKIGYYFTVPEIPIYMHTVFP